MLGRTWHPPSFLPSPPSRPSTQASTFSDPSRLRPSLGNVCVPSPRIAPFQIVFLIARISFRYNSSTVFSLGSESKKGEKEKEMEEKTRNVPSEAKQC